MRIAGVTIPDNKRLEYALTAIYGIGLTRAREVLDKVGVDYGAKAPSLSPEQEKKIAQEIEKFKIEGELKREVAANIKRLKDIGTYRGDRHSRRLPVRGQRTRTNSRTVRGNVRRTMTSGKVKIEKK